MSKSAIVWIIVGASLVLLGAIIFGGVMMSIKWDFKKLSTVRYETNRYEISENYKNISIDTSTADIVFLPSTDGVTAVVCYEQIKEKHAVSVKDNTVCIEIANTKKWYEYVGVTFDTPKITVYIPEGEYGALRVKNQTGDLEIPDHFKFESLDVSGSTGNVNCFASVSDAVKIKVSTGHIQVDGISAGSLDLAVSTGRVRASSIECDGTVRITVSTGKNFLTDVKCKSLYSSGSTGDVSLERVIAEESFSVERTTGDIELEGCDAAELWLKTSTGDVEGSLLSEKIFITNSKTGDIEVPKSTSGGRCEISTSTGDIEIEIK